MKKVILFIICFYAHTLSAQIHSTDGGMSAYRKIVKDDYGQASLTAYYKIDFLKDSTQRGNYSEAQCVLQISDNYLCFGDYHQLIADSLEIEFKRNRKSRTQANSDLWDNAVLKVAFRTKVITDLQAQTIRAQVFTGLKDYEYSAPQPLLQWNLVAGDSIINDLPCKKAVCRYAGREYTAWYAESMPMPYGPYIFNGLPGLIMKIQDTKGNWIFTNNGISKNRGCKDMYLYKKGFISGEVKTTTREKALEALRNETENFSNLMVEVCGLKELRNGVWVTPEANNPREPSNLIELEW